MPVPSHDMERLQSYLMDVENKKFGETGPQLAGTRTVPTQYSLDHYLA